MKLPSKELLSEVLGLKINLVEIDEARNKVFYYCNQFGRITGEINIYELANKCKEWANNKGYVIFSSVQLTGLSVFIQTDQDGIIASFEGIEPEAIFKACEWIMGRTKCGS